MTAIRPTRILIAAMGGEGGGVLTDWIVGAARAEGLKVQATSIPGVAQRTGATTYYIEILPKPLAASAIPPALSLYPVLGDVDVMVATEILEAARAVANGFVTRDRTLLIASTHRVFSVAEKSAMADGRLDMARLLRGCRDHSRQAILFDMDEAARESGSVLNAVLLGAMAGSSCLPVSAESLAHCIRAEGKAVDSNLAGFAFGLAHARGEARDLAREVSPRAMRVLADDGAQDGAGARAAVEFDGPHKGLIGQAVARLTDYQDDAYAQLYLRRLSRIRDAERQAGGDGSLLREVARHLAARMSFEDVVRVAQLKIAPERIGQIRREIRAQDGEPVVVVDYFKPGIEELCSLLPPALARPILRFSERRGWLGRAYVGLHVKSNSVLGYLRLKALAKLKWLRPGSHRFAEEQKDIEIWLEAVLRACPLDLALAREIAECARLIKGYGDTHRRGMANWRQIHGQVIGPALAGKWPARAAGEAVMNARIAAAADPEGRSLRSTLAAIAGNPHAVEQAAQ